MPKAKLIQAAPQARVAAAGGPKISLAMIVRNEAEGLARCLCSVAAGVDEIVIVDTGSTDDTVAIARGFTNRVFQIEWPDDFAAARELAFAKARGEWILWLDGDDEFSGHLRLKDLVKSAADDVTAFAFRYITGLDECGQVTQQFWRERLVRAGRYRWTGRIHEVLEPIGEGRQVESDACVVTHRGKTGAAAAGLARNVRMLREEVAKGGQVAPRLLFYLGRDLMASGELEEARIVLERYLTLSTWAEEAYNARLFLARISLLTGNQIEAYRLALEALGEWPAWPQAYFLLAEIAYYRAQWPKVMAWCDIGRGLPLPDASLFLDPLALRAGWIIYYTNALYHCGHVSEALEWTRRALDLVPRDVFHSRNLAFFTAAALGSSAGSPRAPAVELTSPAAGPS